MVDIILGIKGTLAESSAEAYELFQKGGFSAEELTIITTFGGKWPKEENFLGYVNTPLMTDVNGMQYCMARVDDEFVEPLVQIGETNTAWFVDVVDPENPFMVEVDAYDMDGNKVGTKMQEINGIA